MAASTAAVTAGTTSKQLLEDAAKLKAKKQAEMGVSGEVAPTGEAAGAVAPHGDEAHTGGGAAAPVTAQPKKKGGMWGGIGRALGGLFYKMPASGAKYNNSPINKNFGDAKARGFDSPLDLKSFGVGSLKGGVSAKPRSKTGAGGKF